MSLKTEIHKKILELDPESFLYQLFEYVLDNIFENLEGSPGQKNLASNFGLEKVQLLADILADQLSSKIPYNNALSSLMVLKNRYDTKLKTLPSGTMNESFVSKKKPEYSPNLDQKPEIVTTDARSEAQQKKHLESPNDKHALEESKKTSENHSAGSSNLSEADRLPNQAENLELNGVQQDSLSADKNIESAHFGSNFDDQKLSETSDSKTENPNFVENFVENIKDPEINADSHLSSSSESNKNTSKNPVSEIGSDTVSNSVSSSNTNSESINSIVSDSVSTATSINGSNTNLPDLDKAQANTDQIQNSGTKSSEISAKHLYLQLKNSLSREDTPAAVKIVIKDIGIEIEQNKILVSLSNTLLLKQITSVKCMDYLKSVWQEKNPNIWQNFVLEAYKRGYKEFSWENSGNDQNIPQIVEQAGTSKTVDNQPKNSPNNVSNDLSTGSASEAVSSSFQSEGKKQTNQEGKEMSLGEKIKNNFKNLAKNNTQEDQYFDGEQDFGLVYTEDSDFDGSQFLENSQNQPKHDTQKQQNVSQGQDSDDKDFKSKTGVVSTPKIQAPKIQSNKNNFSERPLKKEGKYFYSVYAPDGQSRYNIPAEVEKLTQIKDPEDSLDFEDILDDFDLE